LERLRQIQGPFVFPLRSEQIRLQLGIGGVRGRQFIIKLFQPNLLFRQRRDNVGRRVSNAPELTVFGYIVEVSEELIELFLGDWIEAVIVAARTTQRQTQKYGGRRVDAIDDVFHGVLVGDDAAF